MPTEHHERHIRGWFIPIEIVNLFQNGTINAKELVLLSTIDSLVCNTGKDCFASIAYLGKQIRSKESRTREMISHLKKLGVLIETGFDGRKRYMRTIWSRIGHRKIPDQPTGKPEGSPPGNRGDNNTRGISKSNPPAKTPRVGTCSALQLRKKARRKFRPIATEMAEQLKAAIGSVRKVPTNATVKSWVTDIVNLHVLDGYEIEDIEKAMDWYCAQVRKRDVFGENPNYVPVIRGGKKFRKRFEDLLSAMEKATASRKGTQDQQARKIRVVKSKDPNYVPEGLR